LNPAPKLTLDAAEAGPIAIKASRDTEARRLFIMYSYITASNLMSKGTAAMSAHIIVIAHAMFACAMHDDFDWTASIF
jgi:hypothetical protein